MFSVPAGWTRLTLSDQTTAPLFYYQSAFDFSNSILPENYSDVSRVAVNNDKTLPELHLSQFLLLHPRTHSPGFQPAGKARWAGRWPWEMPPAASGARDTAGSWWDGVAGGLRVRGQGVEGEGDSGWAQSLVRSLQHPVTCRETNTQSNTLFISQLCQNIHQIRSSVSSNPHCFS